MNLLGEIKIEKKYNNKQFTSKKEIHQTKKEHYGNCEDFKIESTMANISQDDNTTGAAGGGLGPFAEIVET